MRWKGLSKGIQDMCLVLGLDEWWRLGVRQQLELLTLYRLVGKVGTGREAV